MLIIEFTQLSVVRRQSAQVDPLQHQTDTVKIFKDQDILISIFYTEKTDARFGSCVHFVCFLLCFFHKLYICVILLLFYLCSVSRKCHSIFKNRKLRPFFVSVVLRKFISLSVGCLQFPLKRKNKKNNLFFKFSSTI